MSPVRAHKPPLPVLRCGERESESPYLRTMPRCTRHFLTQNFVRPFLIKVRHSSARTLQETLREVAGAALGFSFFGFLISFF